MSTPPRSAQADGATARAPGHTGGARPLRQAVSDHLGSGQVSKVVYGAIIGLALVVALEHHPPPDGAVVATLLATALAVGLAEVYSETLGIQTRLHRRPDRGQVRHMRHDFAAVAFGVGFPAVFFILAAAGAMKGATAFTVAKWTGLGLISFYGFCAARLSGASVPRSLLQAVAVGLIGAVLIAIKALIH